ncbi:MAG: hypothetical protein Q8934_16740 [Bacillota bacterium]|nr:hypothetical protein [Bacillota bacterium]
MANLSTGPFFIPKFIQGTSHTPINILILTIGNLTNRTLSVRTGIYQASIPSFQIVPLLPEADFTLPPNKVASIATPLFKTSSTTITETDTMMLTDSQVLVVTVSGDIEKSGRLAQVSITGGFSSDGTSLDISEPTMFFRHDDFVGFHNHHIGPIHHPLEHNHE